jgi:hypothetical protein
VPTEPFQRAGELAAMSDEDLIEEVSGMEPEELRGLLSLDSSSALLARILVAIAASIAA